MRNKADLYKLSNPHKFVSRVSGVVCRFANKVPRSVVYVSSVTALDDKEAATQARCFCKALEEIYIVRREGGGKLSRDVYDIFRKQISA